jgi:hypothetical protein
VSVAGLGDFIIVKIIMFLRSAVDKFMVHGKKEEE